jgi:uncharacterized membrane protein YdcZ (DUF606 family)
MGRLIGQPTCSSLGFDLHSIASQRMLGLGFMVIGVLLVIRRF